MDLLHNKKEIVYGTVYTKIRSINGDREKTS